MSAFAEIAERIEQRGLTRSICVTGRHALGKVCVSCAFFGHENAWRVLYATVGSPEHWARRVSDSELLDVIRGLG